MTIDRTPSGLIEAQLYELADDTSVYCHLCAHHCKIARNRAGACRVRQNIDGRLYTLVYENVISRHIDPIEKKPLFHFYPGSAAYSIATPGCNFRCWWCQNWEIARIPCGEMPFQGDAMKPAQVVAAAQAAGCRSIAYTYTEPTIFFEYALDTARLAADVGLSNVYVTNGYMSQGMIRRFRPYLHAANVDLKAFRDITYKRYVGARLQPVLDSMKLMKQLGIWLEVTTLVIPGINDDPAELRDAAVFIAHELGADTPWHISRFFPAHKMRHHPSTPPETLRRAAEIGRTEGLKYVYVGNVQMESSEDTFCPTCDELLIRRRSFAILKNVINGGSCPSCGRAIAGVGL